MTDIKKHTVYYEKFLMHSHNNPEKTAAVDSKGRKATYKDFVNVYDTLLPFFKEHSVMEYDRIVILAQNDIDMGLLLLPVMDAAVLIPINPDMAQEKFEYYYDLLRVSYILTDDPLCAGYKAAENKRLGIIHFDISGERDEILCKVRMVKKADREKEIQPPQTPEFIIVRTTSGTTSTPKIVPNTYLSHDASRRRKIKAYDYNSSSIVLLTKRVYNTLATDEMLIVLYVGGMIIIGDGFNHGEFLDLINNYRVTMVTIPPAILASFADYAEKNNLKLNTTHLKYIRAGGAPISKSLKDRIEVIMNAPVIKSYGMSETKNLVTTYKAPKGDKEGSAGVTTGSEIKILNNEIMVRSDTVFKGYENPEIDNNEYFTEGWFHTGDMGYIDNDGYIFITGRIKEMINRGGEKISPYEVESTIISHKDIKDAAVFPYPNNYGSEDAGAVITLVERKELNLTELRNYLTGKILPYKMPTLLYIVDKIPKSENDKVQRKLLYNQIREMYPNINNDIYYDDGVNLTLTEKSIRRIWKNVLKKSNIKLDDSFTALGGDSLNGAVVLSEIELKFNVRLPVNTLFEGGTIRKIAELIEAEKIKKINYKFLVPVKASGNMKPLICVHSGIGDAVTYRHIGRNMEKDRPVYALRFRTKGTTWPLPLSFEYLSRQYVDEIKRMDPKGPYYLCGNCWGGVLAFKIASMLKRDGCKVGMLAMFDSAPKNEMAKARIKEHESLFKWIKKTISESLSQLKHHTFKEKILLIIRKFKNVINLVRLVQAKKIYRLASKRNIKILGKFTGKAGALGYAYQEYKPEFYDDRLYYFKALKGRSQNIKNREYWSGMAGDFQCIEMNCHHNDMIIGEDSKILTKTLSEIMRKMNA